MMGMVYDVDQKRYVRGELVPGDCDHCHTTHSAVTFTEYQYPLGVRWAKWLCDRCLCMLQLHGSLPEVK